jgi:hypothetical protein
MPIPPSSHSPERRRRTGRGVLALAGVAAAGVASFAITDAVTGDAGRRADLLLVQDVPDDVRREVGVVWGRFVDRFASRSGCFADVEVVLVREVAGGDARYVAEHARIEIRIPTTPARFRESLAHELAHHVEATCPAFAGLRSTLRPLLGGADRPWSGGEVWAEIPSERWAEAVVELVNGERVRHTDTVPVDDDVLDLIRRWAAGDDVRTT